MSLPKGPFTFESITAKGAPAESLGNGHVYLLDANGRKIASLWGKPDEKLALAHFICDASEQVGK